MNLKHAQYMLAVLTEGSVTNAAKKLYVSQPSLSQMIKLVETNLGTPIFNRNSDPISLTYAGQKYMKAARQILTINNNLQKEIDELISEEFGTIRLGIPVQRAMQVLPYLLPRFRKRFPLVDVIVFEHGSTTTEAMVLQGEVDIACLTTYPKHEELEYILVEKENLILLTSKESAISKRIEPGTPIDITEAKDEIFVNIRSGHSVRTTQDKLFIQKDIQPKVLLETISIEVAKRTAIACDAVMICPENYLYTSPDLLSKSAVYPISGIENKRSFYICYHKELYLTKYMNEFISILTATEQPFTKAENMYP